ncbi:MAG: 2-oxoacid:acceptor oxidoreductase family protein [Nitrospinales bacterium]
MLRIRFHGRGGQGIKTASQILGTAGYLAGFQAQDFPLYGVERRGAPIVAYTRLDSDIIRERGAIPHPDLIMIGDETLLETLPMAPLIGADEHTAIFINSTHSPSELKQHYKLPALPQSLNLTDLCLQYIKHEMVLSTALAAASVQLSGRIRMELMEHGIRKEMLEANLALAQTVFDATAPAHFTRRVESKLISSELALPDIDALPRAAPVILSEANMQLRKTGNWRLYRPEINEELCNNCWICFARCPEGTISVDENLKPQIDYDHCKGCLICAEECPTHAIQFTREVSSWV